MSKLVMALDEKPSRVTNAIHPGDFSQPPEVADRQRLGNGDPVSDNQAVRASHASSRAGAPGRNGREAKGECGARSYEQLAS